MVDEADVWTIGGGDVHINYLRGQFTVHNYKKGNKVTELWKSCTILSTISKAISYLSIKKKLAVDEGCYSRGVFNNPKVRISVFHWQQSSWGNPIMGKPNKILIVGKAIISVWSVLLTSSAILLVEVNATTFSNRSYRPKTIVYQI